MKETKGEGTYVRLTQTERHLLERQAELEERPMSDVLRRALRTYVKHPPVEPAAAPPTPQERAGEWLRSLPDEARMIVWRVGEALRGSRPPQPPAHLRKALGIHEKKGKARKGTG